ncbi:ATP-binding protein [Nocardiopsis sp. YSL2]|uniref:ATP-binding protein n=1 Tax=Nocardiopsis sp. YSL2 TaxID=2939492 RepID=UPI0026F40FEF|nr:ATP-binding protein [Nocardiopsis sp. YSL2]
MPVQKKGSRRCGESTGYFDGRFDQVRRIREWCQKAIRMDDKRAAPVLLILSELATNAIQHSASGDQYGRVRVTVEVMPGDFVLLRVIDDGPRAGRPVTRPYVPGRIDELSIGGYGLALVSALSEKWWWTDHPQGVAVWVLIDPHRSADDD